MINLTQIAWRFLLGRNSSGLISFSFYLSIIGLAIGTASLLLISAFSSGFSKKVQTKLATIDGEIRIEKYSYDNNSQISNIELEKLKLKIKNISGIKSLSEYSQTQAMLQSGQQSDGTLLFGVNNSLLNDLLSESSFQIFENFENNNIILGLELAKNMGLSIGDEVNLFDLNLLTNKQQIRGVKLNLIGTVSTGFSEYDKLISFIPQNTFNEFYNINSITGIIINTKTIDNIEVSNFLRDIINFPYIVNTWQERHSILLQWMNIYYIPIQLVMSFITLLAIFNISSTLWMISLDKIGNVCILKTMGFSDIQIRNIFILKGLIIGLMGISIGILFSGIIYFIQEKYKVFTLSSEVYFLDYLPMSINYFEIISIIFIISFSTLFFSLIPANKIKSVVPNEILREN